MNDKIWQRIGDYCSDFWIRVRNGVACVDGQAEENKQLFMEGENGA